MAYIPVTQTALRVKLRAKTSHATVTVALIKYRDPDGATGSWTATKSATSTSSGIVYYDLSAVPGTVNGYWYFWIHFTYEDGRVAAGKPVKKLLADEGFFK